MPVYVPCSLRVHIELLDNLEASSFINAFQRFIARRGKPKLIHSNNGTDYKGAEKVLSRCLYDLNEKDPTIKDFMLKNEIKWIFNTPSTPHHGGSWERQIHLIKKTLIAVAGGKLLTMSDEQLNTFLCIVESIINQIEQNIKVDDLVLLMDEKSPCFSWPMGKVIEDIKG